MVDCPSTLPDPHQFLKGEWVCYDPLDQVHRIIGQSQLSTPGRDCGSTPRLSFFPAFSIRPNGVRIGVDSVKQGCPTQQMIPGQPLIDLLVKIINPLTQEVSNKTPEIRPHPGLDIETAL
jgi:hypothetical protein